MSYSLWYRFRKREYTRQKRTEFYPPAFDGGTEICVGTKSRNLGDALILTPLFSKLKQAYPQTRRYGFVRAFNPVSLENHPDVDGILRGPRILFGDDVNFGSGHMIEQKLRWFGLPYTADEIKPVIYLSQAEKTWAQETLKRLFPESNARDPNAPLWVIHPWGKTWRTLLSAEAWAEWLKAIPASHRILQVGIPGEAPIPGACFYELNPNTHASARELFALMSFAQRFIGVDSGPMHVARAFSMESLILVHTKAPGTLVRGMELRPNLPYFHPEVRPFLNLYADQSHLEVSDLRFRERVFDWIRSSGCKPQAPRTT